MKALCFYVTAGKGHYVPANAIYERLTELGVDAQLWDFFEYIGSKFFDKVNQGTWRMLLRHSRQERKAMEKLNSTATTDAAILVGKLHARKVRKRLMQFRPDFIISTHPYGGSFMTEILGKLKIDIPVYYFATDVFTVPSAAINNKLKAILIATEEGRAEVLKQGQNEDRTLLCPFPLQKALADSPVLSKQQAREKLGLKDMFTIEFNLGGEGLGNLDLLKKILDASLPVQVVIVGGINEAMRDKLGHILKEHGDGESNVVIAGFVSNVNEYYEASDIIVGRAGINTIVESIYLHRPFLITELVFTVIPSADYVVKYGVGWNACDDTDKQYSIIRDCLENPQLLAEIENNFAKVPIRYSATELARMLIDDCNSMEK